MDSELSMKTIVRKGCFGIFFLLCTIHLFGCTPAIEKIEPGYSNIGDIVVIQGYGFGYDQGSSTILFGSVEATEILHWGQWEIVVRVPEGTPFGDCWVTVHAQETVFSCGFTVEQEPIMHRILAFGDSLTNGSPTHYGGYTYYLDQLLDQEKGSSVVINAGVNGEITEEGLNRFESYITRWNDIQYILLMEGTNDVWDYKDRSLSSAVENLAEMIHIARDDYGLTVFLGTIPPRGSYVGEQESPTTYELVEAIRELAEHEDVELADHYEHFTSLKSWQNYFCDTVHLNDEGYNILTHSWYREVLEDALP